jgi:glycosyltransferase involved in cell wall biosynthesis
MTVVRNPASAKTLPVSVVIPAYNAARFIGETLESISRQTAQAAEVVVVDDGSTDDTAEVVTSVAPEVRVVRIANGGCGMARAAAIQHSRCEWVAPCDADDLWRPDHLERKFALLRRFPRLDVAFSNCFSFGNKAHADYSLFDEAPPGWLQRHAVEDDGESFRLSDPYAALLEFHPAYQTGLMFKREVYEAAGGFLPKYSRWVGEDSEFIRRLSALEGLQMVGDRTPTWGYRRHDNNMSGVRWKNYACKPRILKEHVALGLVPLRCLPAVQQEIDRSSAEAFDVAIWDGALEGAVELFRSLSAREMTWKRRLTLAALRWKRASTP